jgi:hypothetical protein
MMLMLRIYKREMHPWPAGVGSGANGPSRMIDVVK